MIDNSDNITRSDSNDYYVVLLVMVVIIRQKRENNKIKIYQDILDRN